MAMIRPASWTLPTGQPSSMKAAWFTVSRAIRSPVPSSSNTMLIEVVPMSMPSANILISHLYKDVDAGSSLAMMSS